MRDWQPEKTLLIRHDAPAIIRSSAGAVLKPAARNTQRALSIPSTPVPSERHDAAGESGWPYWISERERSEARWRAGREVTGKRGLPGCERRPERQHLRARHGQELERARMNAGPQAGGVEQGATMRFFAGTGLRLECGRYKGIPTLAAGGKVLFRHGREPASQQPCCAYPVGMADAMRHSHPLHAEHCDDQHCCDHDANRAACRITRKHGWAVNLVAGIEGVE